MTADVKGRHKKSVQDGIKDSFAHMSPARGDASQGAFLDIPEISKIDISYIIKKQMGDTFHLFF